MNEFVTIALRASAVYLFIIFAIRLFGKKELAQLSVIDLVFILLISNSVQNAMVGDNSSLPAGLVAATALFGINYLLKQILYRSKEASSFIQGNPLMLIYKGTVLTDHMDQAKITLQELEASVREHGVENISEVDLAILEVDGNISVLSENFKKKSVRRIRAHKMLTKTT